MESFTKCIKYDGRIVCGDLKTATIHTKFFISDHDPNSPNQEQQSTAKYALDIQFHNAPPIYTAYVSENGYDELDEILLLIFTNQKVDLDTIYPLEIPLGESTTRFHATQTTLTHDFKSRAPSSGGIPGGCYMSAENNSCYPNPNNSFT